MESDFLFTWGCSMDPETEYFLGFLKMYFIDSCTHVFACVHL